MASSSAATGAGSPRGPPESAATGAATGPPSAATGAGGEQVKTVTLVRNAAGFWTNAEGQRVDDLGRPTRARGSRAGRRDREAVSIIIVGPHSEIWVTFGVFTT